MDQQAKLPQRRSIRMEGYDYAQAGAYFITVRAHEGRCLFGRIDAAEMWPNALGIIVEEEWHRSALIRSTITLDAFALMPNHLHGVVVIDAMGQTHGSAPTNLLTYLSLQWYPRFSKLNEEGLLCSRPG